MNPVLLTIGNIEIRYYSVIILIAVFIAVTLAIKNQEDFILAMTLCLTYHFG